MILLARGSKTTRCALSRAPIVTQARSCSSNSSVPPSSSSRDTTRGYSTAGLRESAPRSSAARPATLPLPLIPYSTSATTSCASNEPVRCRRGVSTEAREDTSFLFHGARVPQWAGLKLGHCGHSTPKLSYAGYNSSSASHASRRFHSSTVIEESTGNKLRNIFHGSSSDSGELQIHVGRTLYPVRCEDDLDWAMNASPSDLGTLETKVRELTEERERLLFIKETCDKLAHRRAARLAYGLLSIFLSEFAIMVYGTYFLFSWDIMEPISYLLGLIDVICGYGFYTYFRRNYSADDLVGAVRGTLANRAYKRMAFNQEELAHCERQLGMYHHRLLAVKSMQKI